MKFIDYAKSIGKTRGYIHKLCVQGRLDKAIYSDKGRKRINKDIADAILKGLSDKNLYTKQETNSDSRYTNRYTNKNNPILSENCTQNTKITSSQISSKISTQISEQAAFNSDTEFESMTYDQARRMKVYYEAQLEKFHLEKEKGKYLLADDVKKNAYKAGLLFRDKVLSVPAQVSSILSEMTSAFEIKNLLHEYLTTAIEDARHAKIQENPSTENFNSEENSEEFVDEEANAEAAA